MLTAAKADLQPIGGVVAVEKRAGADGSAPAGKVSEMRGSRFPTGPFAQPQTAAGTPPVEAREVTSLMGQVSAARRASIRSVFSQEKPPSASGARPK